MLVGIYRIQFERSTSDFVVACHRLLKAQERDSSMLIFVIKGRQGPCSKSARHDLQEIARDIKLVYPTGDLLKKINAGDLNVSMLELPVHPLPDGEGIFYVEVQPVKKITPRIPLSVGPEGNLFVDIPTPAEPVKETEQ